LSLSITGWCGLSVMFVNQDTYLGCGRVLKSKAYIEKFFRPGTLSFFWGGDLVDRVETQLAKVVIVKLVLVVFENGGAFV